MAIINELDILEWNKWVSTRPEVIQKLCISHPPNRLYKLKESGNRVTIHSYDEDGTMIVNVTGEYNYLAFDRQVFGIKPENIEECDLPLYDDVTGTILTDPDDVTAFIDGIRGGQMKVKLAYNLHFDFDILRLESKLDELIEDQEECFKIMDGLHKHIDIYDERICETKNKILELQKQNDFTYYCRYGRFPND